MPCLLDLIDELKTKFDKHDYIKCCALLKSIKVELLKANILIPDLIRAASDTEYVKDLQVSKNVLEIGAICSMKLEDFDSFENYYAQLLPFYFSDHDCLSESKHKCKLVGVYLLILLSQGNITKFHSELEYLSKNIANFEEDIFLSYPIKIERWLMEGSYQKVWDILQSDSAIEEFNIFSNILICAIREEIARNTEMAYKKLPLFNVKALLFFESEKDTESFAKERNWHVLNGCVIFQDEDISEKIDKTNLIEKALDYAFNLERIV